MGRVKALLPLALLSACTPLQATPSVLPYPGGFLQGSLVTGRFTVTLPGPPLFLDADEIALYAAYPYQILRYRQGGMESLPLPGIPRFLRARGGKAVVGLGEAILLGDQLLPYPARDALYTERGVFWVGRDGLYLDAALLRRGDFTQVVAWEGHVVALGREAYFHPDGQTLPLPHPARKAQVGACGILVLLDRVYLVRREGVRPFAEAEDFAVWNENVYLVPSERVVSCKEAAWP